MTERIDDIFDMTKVSESDLLSDELALSYLHKIRSYRTIESKFVQGKTVVEVKRNDQLLMVMTHLYTSGGFMLYWDYTQEGKVFIVTPLRSDPSNKVYEKRFKAEGPSGSASIGVTG